MTRNNLLRYAQEYAERGLHVFPLFGIKDDLSCECNKGADCRNAGKHPQVEGGFKSATTDISLINEWWGKWPNANIGIATGEISGITVLDIDGDQGFTTLAELDIGFGSLPTGPRVITGRPKGKHLYFLFSPVLSRSSAGILPGIDIRSNGGYVVAPPSMHASGRRYQWEAP